MRHLEEIRVQLYCVTVFSHCVDTIYFQITHCTFNESIAVDQCEILHFPQEDRSYPHPGFCTWTQGTPACSKTARPHRDQGRGTTGLEASLGRPSSEQTPCLLKAEGMGALLCVLPAGGHSHSGHEAISTRGKCKTQFTYADPQLSKAPKPLPLSSLQ